MVIQYVVSFVQADDLSVWSFWVCTHCLDIVGQCYYITPCDISVKPHTEPAHCLSSLMTLLQENKRNLYISAHNQLLVLVFMCEITYIFVSVPSLASMNLLRDIWCKHKGLICSPPLCDSFQIIVQQSGIDRCWPGIYVMEDDCHQRPINAD